MTVCSHDRLPTVAEFCPDDAAVLALSIVRSVAAGYMTGDVACWDVAHAGAESVLGDLDGPALVAALTAVVRALRVERTTEWSFLPATCCRVTADEQALIRLLQSARCGGDLGPCVAGLAGTTVAPRLARAALNVAGVLERVKVQIPNRTSRSAGAPGRPQGAAIH